MTFASANLQGVPWELVTKSYRQYLEDRSHDHLHEYATDFFDFAANHALMFPARFRKSSSGSKRIERQTPVVQSIIKDAAYTTEADAAKKEQFLRGKLNDREAAVRAAKFIANADQADVDGAIARFSSEVVAEFRADVYFQRFVPDGCIGQLALIGIIGVYKEGFSELDPSGIVFAGYGNKDFFPAVRVYRTYGLYWESFSSRKRMRERSATRIRPTMSPWRRPR